MNVSSASAPDSLALFANEIVAAYVSNNHVAPGDLPALISTVFTAFTRIYEGVGSEAGAVEQTVEKPTPAQIRKSITTDALISFIDGKLHKTLRRHLKRHGLDADSYRARYGLPSDYPMVCPSYSAKRSEIAKSLGLGTQRRKFTS